jgi:D-alanyl-D-alanine carboxypeptidase
MPALVALSLNHDRTIVSRIRVTFGRGSQTAGGGRGGYVRSWPERFASRRSWLTALIGVLAFAGGANAAGASPPTSARLAAATDAFAAAHPAYPGVALAVVSPRVHWTGSAGHAALGAGAALDPEAGFRIASVTKTFTAAATLRLAEQGRVGLDDPIADHLAPATLELLRRGGYDPDAIHVRHLLMHTSGLYDYASDPKFVEYVLTHGRHHWTRIEQVRFAITHGKPYGPPGKEFHYADTGYVLLGEIIERTTGRPLASAFRRLLGFEKLDLTRTYLESLETQPHAAHARAHQYYQRIDATAFDPSFDLYGGGGLVSTVDDLARFYRALLNGNVFEKAATLRTMLGKPNPRRVADLGMGIFSNRIGGRSGEDCWAHSGFWGTTVIDCPASNVTLALAVNQANGFDVPSQQFLATILRLVK